MALRAANDRLYARYQLTMIEWFGQEVVGAETQALNLVIEGIEPGQDEDRSAHPGRPQLPQHLISVQIRQQQIKYDYVVIIQLSLLKPVLSKIGNVAYDAFVLEQCLYLCRGRNVVFNEQHAHMEFPRGGSGRRNPTLTLMNNWLTSLRNHYGLRVKGDDSPIRRIVHISMGILLRRPDAACDSPGSGAGAPRYKSQARSQCPLSPRRRWHRR